MDTTIIILSILGGCLSIAGTVFGMGMWLGRKIERIDGKFIGVERDMSNLRTGQKRHSDRLSRHAAEIEAWKMWRAREEGRGSHPHLRPRSEQ